jgi:putative DNA primase/helicase
MKDTDEVFLYKNGVFKEAERDIMAMLQRLIKSSPNRHLPHTRNINSIVDYIKRETYIERKGFDTKQYKIVMLNGIFNLESGNLEPHTPDFLSMIQIPVKFDKSADCPKTKQFLWEVLDNGDPAETQKQIHGFFEALGTCLVKNYSFKRLFLFVGEGNNGKGVVLEIVSNVNLYLS